MDQHLVSDEPWELDYIAEKFGLTLNDVRAGKKKVGNGRRKLYKYLRVKMPLT